MVDKQMVGMEEDTRLADSSERTHSASAKLSAFCVMRVYLLRVSRLRKSEVWCHPEGQGQPMALCLQVKSLIPQVVAAKSHPKFTGIGWGSFHLSANLRLELSSNLRSQSVSTIKSFSIPFLSRVELDVTCSLWSQFATSPAFPFYQSHRP